MDPRDIKLSDSLEGFEGWDKRVCAPEDHQVSTAFVSLRVGGVIGINKTTDQMWGKPDAARLMFDRERRRIGIAPASPDDPRAWRDLGRLGGANINAKRFFEYYGIMPAETRRYTPKFIEGVLIIEL
jgi:hypothetical protein